jgi:hypothetical protein
MLKRISRRRTRMGSSTMTVQWRRLIDFMFSDRRNTRAAHRFLGKALKTMRNWPPISITTDKLGSYRKAIRRLQRDGHLSQDVKHRTSKYLNNIDPPRALHSSRARCRRRGPVRQQAVRLARAEGGAATLRPGELRAGPPLSRFVAADCWKAAGAGQSSSVLRTVRSASQIDAGRVSFADAAALIGVWWLKRNHQQRMLP